MANQPGFITIDINGGDFINNIISLRRLLAENSTWDLLDRHPDPQLYRSGNHPVLPPLRGARPSRWLHIKLVASPSTVTLIVRNDNMYVVGFKNHKEEVFELMGPRDNRGKPTGWSVLPQTYKANRAYAEVCWGVKYRTILDCSNNRVVREMIKLNLNKDFVMDAVRTLSTFAVEQEHNGTARRALVGLIMVLCESTRMNEHLTHFAEGWTSGRPALFTDQLMNLTWNWKNMSQTLLIWNKEYNYDDDRVDLLELRAECSVRSVDEVLDVIYLVYNAPVGVQAGGSSSGASGGNRQDGSTSDRGGNQMAGGGPGSGGHRAGDASGSGGAGRRHGGNQGFPMRGRQRVEVLAVGVNFRPIVGMTVVVFDGIQGQIIYSHDDDEEEELQEALELTGPYIGISADGSFAFQVDIPSSTPDQDGEVWSWEWDGYKADFAGEVDNPVPKEAVITPPQDDPLGRQVNIIYRVLSNAMEADLNVKLQLLDKYRRLDSPKVHGKITAHVDESPRTSATRDGSRAGSVLFSRPTPAKGLDFSSRDAQSFTFLPLARSVVAVPLGWTLYIDWDLHITHGSNQEGVKNFTGSLEFSNGTRRREWQADDDRIEADITWYPEFVSNRPPASSSSSVPETHGMEEK